MPGANAKVSYIHNGKASGSVAARLLRNGMDVGILRPYEDKKGRSVVVVNSGKTGKDGKPLKKAVHEMDMTQLFQAALKGQEPV